ncbi:MAG TPA: DUF6596 domain-containing protein [Polyangiales bacterium]|nr:DUF6596 domain-containing protein [Polyangiales bacterium]
MAQLTAALEDVLRRERGRVLGGLLRHCGSLDAAEEAFQEALLRALTVWPERGIPENPAAWLTTVAKNQARDARKHRGVTEAKASELALDGEASTPPDGIETVSDDQLRLIFACCHPELSRESQVALTLKLLAGFSTEELARAFLCPEPTMAQRIVRAKRAIDDKRLAYSAPERSELHERIQAVLAVVYLIFNEGHVASRGAELTRVDLQAEALRLARLLGELLPRESEVFGLLALIAFSAARAGTRTGDDGELRLLSEQDRSRWSVPLIKEGLLALQRARTLSESAGAAGSYTLQAEISACHATAESWQATPWARIVRCYDALLAIQASPVVALNRAIAVSMVQGPEAALALLEPLREPLARYHIFYATRADFLRQLGRDARADYERAIDLAQNEAERAFLKRKLSALLSA